MKKTKKLLALVLAMVMAFSLMAVTAAAAGVEEHEHTDACSVETIQPRRPGATCWYCGYGMAECGTGTDKYGNYIEFECKNQVCENFGGTQKVYW